MRTTAEKRWVALLAGVAAAALALTGCSATDASESTNSDAAASSDQWPRTFTNADGSTTTIEAQPERIVSTVSVTGTLLSIGAPVVGSGTGGNGAFFGQWEDVAEEQGVEKLWSAGSVDLEALIGANPDLIVTSSSGADSLIDNLDDLKAIAPTIVVDNGGQTWQELAEDLGEATGREDEAKESVEEFDAYVAKARESIAVPEGEANIVAYHGPGEVNQIARAGSAQAGILTDLGFTVEDPDVAWHTSPDPRDDFVWATYENLTELTAGTTFILQENDEGARAFADDPVLANVPSVREGRIYGLGENSFRIDKFSATEIVDSIKEKFSR